MNERIRAYQLMSKPKTIKHFYSNIRVTLNSDFRPHKITMEVLQVYVEKMVKRPELLLGVHAGNPVWTDIRDINFVLKTLLCKNSKFLPLRVENEKNEVKMIPIVRSVVEYSDLPQIIDKSVLYHPVDSISCMFPRLDVHLLASTQQGLGMEDFLFARVVEAIHGWSSSHYIDFIQNIM